MQNPQGAQMEQIKNSINNSIKTAIEHGILESLEKEGKYESPSWASKIEKDVLAKMVKENKISKIDNKRYKKCGISF